MYDEAFVLKFWSQVGKSAGDDGHWFMGRQRSWYGVFNYRGKSYMAHRVACILVYGSVPDDAVVMHLCGDNSCCNPAHLKVSTQSENMSRWHHVERRRYR